MGKKKFPRMDVIEKQLKVVADEEPAALSDEDLANIQGGNVASAMRQLYIMYGVPRPPWFPGERGGNDSGPQKA